MIVRNLRSEWQKRPTTDRAAPRLTWELSSSTNGDAQTVYQVQCGTTAGAIDLWDTGKVTSTVMHASYAGTALVSRQRVYWRVRAWNTAGNASQWTASQFFMGLLSASDWSSAVHIGYQTSGSTGGGYGASAVRKTFTTANKTIARATLYATALGWYRPFINGQRVGQIEQAPGWTDYPQRRLYQAYDVTSLLTANGTNAVALQLGDGQYLGKMSILGRNTYATDVPRGMAALYIDYSDGTTTCIVTDATWKGTATDNSLNDWYDGATHDPRRAA